MLCAKSDTRGFVLPLSPGSGKERGTEDGEKKRRRGRENREAHIINSWIF